MGDMAQFSVKSDNVWLTVEEEGRIAGELGNLESEIRSVAFSLSFSVSSKAGVQRRLIGAAGKVAEHQSCMWSMHSALDDILKSYDNTERAILSNLGVKEAKEPTVQADQQSSNSEENKEEFDWSSLLWKTVGNFGAVGKGLSTIGKFLTGDKSDAKTWADAGSGFWKTGWKIGDAVKKCKKDPDVNWAKEVAGLNRNSFLESIKKSNLSAGQRAMHGFNKEIKSTFREFKTTGGRVKQIGGIAISAVANGIDNYEEYKNGDISVGRAVAETVTETAVDWGKDLLIGAAVTAGFAAIGIAAPAVVVGAATMAVSVAADWACEQVCGKKLTEAVSDAVLDAGEALADGIKTGAKKVAEGVSSAWKGIAEGWNWLTGKT